MGVIEYLLGSVDALLLDGGMAGSSAFALRSGG
jgi:hypothetical protein